MTLKKYIDSIFDLIGVETQEMIKLGGTKLDQFKANYGIDWTPEDIFYNRTGLLLTEVHDYTRVKQFSAQMKEVLNLEMKELHMHCYIFSYVNNPVLAKLLDYQEPAGTGGTP